MEKQDDSGPAFPCEGGATSGLHPNPGMTLRDWFAGQALMGIGYELDVSDPVNCAVTARHCWNLADAMLAARNIPRSEIPNRQS